MVCYDKDQTAQVMSSWYLLSLPLPVHWGQPGLLSCIQFARVITLVTYHQCITLLQLLYACQVTDQLITVNYHCFREKTLSSYCHNGFNINIIFFLLIS